MILLTTSHRPTRRVRSLCNDLKRSIPSLIKVNRGKMSFLDVAERAAQFNAKKFIIVDRWKGGPGRIRLFRITDEGFGEEPPRLYISGVKLRREFKASVQEKNFNSLFIEMHETANPYIEKLKLSLSEFLEIPIFKLGSETLNYEAYMRITSGEDCLAHISFFLLPGKIEVGPRIKISHVVWDI